MADYKYRIFYSDRTICDTEHLLPDQKLHVQAIVQRSDSVGWHVESHGDFYLAREDGLWHAADVDGLKTELEKRSLVKFNIGTIHEVLVGEEWVKVDVFGLLKWTETLDWVLHGETLWNKSFHEIFQRALSHADYGRRNGYLPKINND